MKGGWVKESTRDQVTEFVFNWKSKTEFSQKYFLTNLELPSQKFHLWKEKMGSLNNHNANLPKNGWIQDWEKQQIIEFYFANPLEGYRRLSYMMIDQDVAFVSPSSVYRVLKDYLRRNSKEQSLKGQGFVQPLKPHEHWHIDVSYLNIQGTFYYNCTILDGYSRKIIHHEIRTSMTEQDVEIITLRAKEKYSDESPRIISDNGPQFISKDFKEFIKISGMTHVRTSPYYPQSNGKIERYHQTLKKECIRPKSPVNFEDAQNLVNNFVNEYNNKRLHSAIGYITPNDKMNGREEFIFETRRQKLIKAKALRKVEQLD